MAITLKKSNHILIKTIIIRQKTMLFEHIFINIIKKIKKPLFTIYNTKKFIQILNNINKHQKRLEEAFEFKNNYDPFFIAEIGINHNGSLDLVYELIDLAIKYDCDAVKFQKRNIDIVYSQNILNSPRESPWGKTTRAQKEGLELSLKDYQNIDLYCKEKGIFWSASAWDCKSQEFLQNFNLPFNKVASAMATNNDFLHFVAKEKKKTFVSTGMMENKSVDNIIKIFKFYNTPLCLFHTVSMYPSPEDKLNLNLIKEYKKKYKIPVGYSGHEVTVSPSFIATVLGASAIERHITIDRAMYGSDQAASVSIHALGNLIGSIRVAETLLGDNSIDNIQEGEEVAYKKLKYKKE